MKALPLALCLATSVYGVAIASGSHHSVIVDMPEIVTLTHASPDTWHNLPPAHRSDRPTLAPKEALVFAEVSRVEPRCAVSTARNSPSLVEFF
jgi:hypothetical protein